MKQKSMEEFIAIEDSDNTSKSDNMKSDYYQDMVNKISRLDWKKLPYSKQNWGIWLHRMSSYIGRIKPAIAHLLIKYCTKENDVVLDPFCGIGTIPLEANLSGRKVIGSDLSPYAYVISKAKFDRKQKVDLINWVKKQDIDYHINSDWLEERFLEFYHPKTLKELTFFRKKIMEEEEWFILGCVLGILHGHRPAHLSAITNLVVPYKPRTKATYKNVAERIITKIERMYKDRFPSTTNGIILKEDARNLTSIQDESVDCIITSPPYYSTLDYVEDNRLRFNFLGYNTIERKDMKKELIQSEQTYLIEMERVGREMQRTLKQNHPCILILGDHCKNNKIINTAVEIESVFTELGFKSHGIIDDMLPLNKSLPTNIKRLKFDRFLVLQNT